MFLIFLNFYCCIFFINGLISCEVLRLFFVSERCEYVIIEDEIFRLIILEVMMLCGNEVSEISDDIF